MSSVIVNTTIAAPVEVTYQMTGCGVTDGHAIPANSLINGFPDPIPSIVGYAVSALDPLIPGGGGCLMSFQAKQAAAGPTETIKGQQTTVSDESCVLFTAQPS